MIDVQRAPRNPNDTAQSLPYWMPLWDGENGAWSATVVCPFGHAATLLDHVIDAVGRVHPSIECPVPGCGFHETIKLLGWPPTFEVASQELR